MSRSSFIWGMLDPVSGAHMAERIRERLPAAPFGWRRRALAVPGSAGEVADALPAR